MDAKVIVVAEQGHSIQGIMTAPVFNEKPIFSDEEWQKLAEGLEKLGDLAHEKVWRLFTITIWGQESKRLKKSID